MGSAAECYPCGPPDVSLLWPQYMAAPAFELESILEKSIDSILPSRIFQACEGTDARFKAWRLIPGRLLQGYENSGHSGSSLNQQLSGDAVKI